MDDDKDLLTDDIQDAGEGAGDPGAEPKHPLAPGGQRFEQVYAKMRDAERENQALRERMAAIEGRLSAQPAQQTQLQPPVKFYSAKELDAFVEAGQMSPLEAADRLAWQRQQEGLAVAAQQRQYEAKLTRAGDEVRAYTQKLPNLLNTQTEEFRRLAASAYEVAEDMGLSVGDARVQRRALREVFGPLERLTEKGRAREFDRRSADGFSDTSRGSGASGDSNDPLAKVPREFLEDWKRRGYSKDQMLAEAKYVRPTRRFPA